MPTPSYVKSQLEYHEQPNLKTRNEKLFVIIEQKLANVYFKHRRYLRIENKIKTKSFKTLAADMSYYHFYLYLLDGEKDDICNTNSCHL